MLVTDTTDSRRYLESAINHNNGDVTGWSLYLIAGDLARKIGSLMEAQSYFTKALSYDPYNTTTKARLEEVTNLINSSDRVVIKFK
jgi:hypothetical protein